MSILGDVGWLVRSRSLRVAMAVAIVGLALVSSPPDSDATPLSRGEDSTIQELRRQRDEVRKQKLAKATSVDVLKSSEAEVSSALTVLTANVSSQRDLAEEAERLVAQAAAEKVSAETAQDAKQAELEAIASQMRESAVDAFVNMASGGRSTGIDASDANDIVQKKTLVGMRANQQVDLTEKFRSVQEDLQVQVAAADSAAKLARENQAAMEVRLTELDSAVDEQRSFAAKVERRLEAALAEADSLAALDAKLASSIDERQAALARVIEAQRAELAARAARAAASRTRQAAARPTLRLRSPQRTSTEPPDRSGTAPAPIVGSGEIVNVAGIRVHRSLAANLQALLSAASAAGIQFGGGGYRDSAGQIAVRRNNCGNSNYAIYEMRASQCSPPTARPGSSMHERGLAIDFTQGGRTLTRRSPGFAWLKSNAAQFGLKNLPSEPWHWSTNGN